MKLTPPRVKILSGVCKGQIFPAEKIEYTDRRICVMNFNSKAEKNFYLCFPFSEVELVKEECKHKEYLDVNGKKHKVVCPNCAGEPRGLKAESIHLDEAKPGHVGEEPEVPTICEHCAYKDNKHSALCSRPKPEKASPRKTREWSNNPEVDYYYLVSCLADLADAVNRLNGGIIK